MTNNTVNNAAAHNEDGNTDPTTAELAIEEADNPCQLVCSMERESGFCFGCGRTQEEISYWSEKTPEERQAILAILPARMPPLIKLREERRAKRRVNKRRRKEPE